MEYGTIIRNGIVYGGDSGEAGASSWEELENKPFDSLSVEFTSIDGVLGLNGEYVGDRVQASANLTDGTTIGSITINGGEPVVFKASAGVQFKKVEALPEEGQSNIIYLLPAESTEEEDIYVEYYWAPVVDVNAYEVWVTSTYYDFIPEGTPWHAVISKEVWDSHYGDNMNWGANFYEDPTKRVKLYTSRSGAYCIKSQYGDNSYTIKDASDNPDYYPQKRVNETITYKWEILGKTSASAISSWQDLEDKPFETLSEKDFNIDSNKELSVKSKSIPLTFEEYNALSEEEKMADIVYYITDAPGTSSDVSKSVSLSTQGGRPNTLRFGYDAEKGVYGYYPPGADALIPFKGSNGISIIDEYKDSISEGQPGGIYILSDGGLQVLAAGSTSGTTYLKEWIVKKDRRYMLMLGKNYGNRFRAGLFNFDIFEKEPTSSDAEYDSVQTLTSGDPALYPGYASATFTASIDGYVGIGLDNRSTAYVRDCYLIDLTGLLE